MPWTEHCAALKFPHYPNFKYSVKWSNGRIDQNKTNRKANMIAEHNIYARYPMSMVTTVPFPLFFLRPHQYLPCSCTCGILGFL